MKKKGFLLLFLNLAFFNLFPSPYDMIPAGDPALEDLRFLALESNCAFLSFTPPLAFDEIGIFLDSIEVDGLSPRARDAYLRLKKRLSPEFPVTVNNGYFTFSLNINSVTVIETRFNTDISWEPRYDKIPALLSVPFRFGFADSIQLYFEPAVVMDPEYYRGTCFFNSNIPYKFESLDMTIPLRAFIAAGGPWWNFQLGRDRLSFGTGITGNLSVSENPAFYEFARLSFFSKNFKYSIMINQMPLEITKEIYDGSLSVVSPAY